MGFFLKICFNAPAPLLTSTHTHTRNLPARDLSDDTDGNLDRTHDDDPPRQVNTEDDDPDDDEDTHKVVDVSCGGCFTVAVMKSGRVAVWGIWTENRY